jgi:ketosteroid isomerase-like protein
MPMTVPTLSALALAVAAWWSGGVRPPSFAAPASPAPAEDTLGATRRRLLSMDSLHAHNTTAQGVDAGLPSLFAENVVYLADGRPIVRGRGGAEGAIRDRPAGSLADLRWRAARVDVSADATHGYVYGYAQWSSPDSSGRQAPRYGKYISYWQKDQAGEWRIAAYVLAPSAGPPGPATLSERPDTAGGGQDASPTSAVASSPAEGRAALIGADSAFSARSVAEDVAVAFSTYVAPDGAVLSGGPGILYGPDAIRKAFAGAARTLTLTWSPRLAEIAGSGDLGFTVGEATTRSRNNAGPPRVSYSKYLTVWRRQRDGTWRFVVDGGNDRPASPS